MGPIPKFLGSFLSLTQLLLQNNQFTGKTSTFFLYMQLEFGIFISHLFITI